MEVIIVLVLSLMTIYADDNFLLISATSYARAMEPGELQNLTQARHHPGNLLSSRGMLSPRAIV